MAHKCTYNWTSAWNQCSRLLLTNRNNAALGYFCIGFTAETQKLSPYYTQSVCGTSPAFSFSVRQSKLNSNLSAVGETVLGFPVPLTLQTLHKYSITNLSGLQPLIIVFISHKKKTTFKTLQETGLTAHAQIASIEAIWAGMNPGLSWELHCTFGALGSNVWKPRFETLILRTRRRPTDWYWLTGEMLGSYSLSEILYWFVGVENVLERRLRNFLTNFSCLLLNPEG